MQDPAFQPGQEEAVVTQPRHEAAKLQRPLPTAAARSAAQSAEPQQQERSIEQCPLERLQRAAGPLTAAAAGRQPDTIAAGRGGARSPVPAVPVRSQVVAAADGMAGRHPGTQVAAALAALQQALTVQDGPVLGAAGSPCAGRLQSNQQGQLWAAAVQVLQDYPETEVAHVLTMLLEQQQNASACMADVVKGEPADLAEAGGHPPSGMAGAGEGAPEEAGEGSPDPRTRAEHVQCRQCSTDGDCADAWEDQQQPGGEAADELSQLEAEVQQLQQQQRGSSSALHMQQQQRGSSSAPHIQQQQRGSSSALQGQEQEPHRNLLQHCQLRAHSLQAAAAEIMEAYPGTEVAQALSLLQQLLLPDVVDPAASRGLQLLEGTAELGPGAPPALQAVSEAPRHQER